MPSGTRDKVISLSRRLKITSLNSGSFNSADFASVDGRLVRVLTRWRIFPFYMVLAVFEQDAFGMVLYVQSQFRKLAITRYGQRNFKLAGFSDFSSAHFIRARQWDFGKATVGSIPGTLDTNNI